jgi:hypothetical protein
MVEVRITQFISATLLVCLFAGCTTTSLERHTVHQTLSVSDIRYQEILDDFARLRANPGIMPSFATLSSGASVVTDTVSVDSATLWDQALHGFSRETLTPTGRHNPDPNWTLAPVVAAPHLEALRFAFLSVLYGPPQPGSLAYSLLGPRGPNDYSPHFNVLNDLAILQPGATWLHFTNHHEIPKNACYTGHCHDLYVSVTPEGMQALSEFTLIVLDIATTDPASLTPPVPTADVERSVTGANFVQSENPKPFATCNGCQPLPPTGECLPCANEGCGESTQPSCPPDKGVTYLQQEPAGGTKITEGWPVMQCPDGTIYVLQPQGWCDVNTLKIVSGATAPVPQPINRFKLQ